MDIFPATKKKNKLKTRFLSIRFFRILGGGEPALHLGSTPQRRETQTFLGWEVIQGVMSVTSLPRKIPRQGLNLIFLFAPLPLGMSGVRVWAIYSIDLQ